MKKIYHAPILTETVIKTRNHLLSGSLSKNGEVITSGTSGGWTKEQNRSTYNIWDDDWNK